jgi:hypothetical protein
MAFRALFISLAIVSLCVTSAASAAEKKKAPTYEETTAWITDNYGELTAHCFGKRSIAFDNCKVQEHKDVLNDQYLYTFDLKRVKKVSVGKNEKYVALQFTDEGEVNVKHWLAYSPDEPASHQIEDSIEFCTKGEKEEKRLLAAFKRLVSLCKQKANTF